MWYRVAYRDPTARLIAASPSNSLAALSYLMLMDRHLFLHRIMAKDLADQSTPVSSPLSSSSASTSTASNSHPYCRPQEASMIQGWTTTVPTSTSQRYQSDLDQDAAIQAYLEAKMALFQAVGVDPQMRRTTSPTHQTRR